MLQYFFRRLLVAIPLLLAVLVGTFVMNKALPGDPIAARFNKSIDSSDADAFKKARGLDRPIHEQFVDYAVSAAQLDFGLNAADGEVYEDIKTRLPATMELAFFAMLIALTVGVSIGSLTALKPRSWFDMGGLSFALLGVSMPIFWLGLLVISFFQANGVLAGWFPGFEGLPTGQRYPDEFLRLPEWVAKTPSATGIYTYDTAFVAGDWGAFRGVALHLVLPAFVLASVPMAIITRITRASVGEAMLQDYIRTARAKGLGTRAIVCKHALRNAAIPIVTSAGTQFGYLLGGAVLTETIFRWPGMGTYVVSAIDSQDWNALNAAVLIAATAFILINLVVDLCYGLLDPRVKAGGGTA